MNVTYVMSGKCRLCTTGHPAGFRDLEGKPLFTGDIVAIFTDGGDGAKEAHSLTAVVRDQFASFSDGTFIARDEPGDCFVMGIKSVPMDDPGHWRVWKLKDHRDVIPGEHWTAYGFSYQSENAA